MNIFIKFEIRKLKTLVMKSLELTWITKNASDQCVTRSRRYTLFNYQTVLFKYKFKYQQETYNILYTLHTYHYRVMSI